MYAVRNWRRFSTVVLLMLHAGILSLLPMPATADDPVVTFPDTNLEAAIRLATGKPAGDIYASDLAGLTDIDLSTKGIINLSGLEYCTGLTKLSLSNNHVINLAPIAGLANLEDLNLEDNQVSDLAPLAGLTRLTVLNLPRNRISNLTPLAGLANLSALNLGDNQISNLTPIAGLNKLTILNLQNNFISNQPPLAGLANLLALNLQNNQVSNPTLLVGMNKLAVLNLQNNQVVNLGSLAGLAELLALNLQNNQVSDVSPLAGLTKLAIINLQNNRVSDVAPLAANAGLAAGDAVDLLSNPLNRASVDVHIPALEARSAIVVWDTAAPEYIPNSIDFNPVAAGGSGVPQVITITNIGKTNLVVGTITLSGANAGEFLIIGDGASNQTITPGASKSVSVIFRPSESGVKTATLSILSNAPGGSSSTVTLTGLATPASGVSNVISTRPHSASMPSAVTNPPPIQLPNVYVQKAALSASEVMPDSPVYVTATVANSGSVNGTVIVKLIVNGAEEGRQSFSVAGRSSIPVTLTVQKSQPGIYAVTVNNVPAGSFAVSDYSTVLYISIVCLFLAFILGIILIYRRFTV